ncbi:MAG: FKBP-type peptidyl-prolyl cis-trans isomerase [Prevotella sp.]|nr:FKBP-type peptidyl-prolyl cis-trans isomerase [Prevotella sp.]
MKRIIIVALVLVTSASFNSVQAQQLLSRTDTLSYAIGMAQTQGLVDFLKNRQHMDLDYMDNFIEGLREAIASSSDKGKTAFFIGTQIGQQVANQMLPGINKEIYGNDSTKSISTDLFLAGFISGTTGKDGLMTVKDANDKAQTLMKEVKTEELMKKFGDNKKAGEQFLAKNGKKKDVNTLESGIQYKVLRKGTGIIPKVNQKVKVHYEGRLLNGKVFDSSYKRGEPTEFRCTQVIKGWTEALTHMPVGSLWEVYIPQELAYGEHQQGKDIDPFSMLIFKIELLEIVDKQKQEE